jgi:hypothetical protein
MAHEHEEIHEPPFAERCVCPEEVAAPADTDSRRRYYAITPEGRSVLRAESERLAELVRLARDAHVLPSPEGRT